jgi:hypothetical protein
MSLTNQMENIVLDAMLGVGATLMSSSIQLALSTTDPGEDGTGITEPAGFGYARLVVANDGANFSAASDSIKTNAATLSFAAASGGSWGAISHWAIYDGGIMKLKGIIDDGAGTPSPITVNDADVFRFLAGDMRITVD